MDKLDKEEEEKRQQQAAGALLKATLDVFDKLSPIDRQTILTQIDPSWPKIRKEDI